MATVVNDIWIENSSFHPAAEPLLVAAARRAGVRHVSIGHSRGPWLAGSGDALNGATIAVGWAPVRVAQADGCGRIIGYISDRLLLAPYGVSWPSDPSAEDVAEGWSETDEAAPRTVTFPA